MPGFDHVIAELLAIEGAIGAAVADLETGVTLAHGGAPGFSLETAAAGHSAVVRAERETLRELGLPPRIDDIMITLGSQYHVINVVGEAPDQRLFLYLTLSRRDANLALARHKLARVARAL